MTAGIITNKEKDPDFKYSGEIKAFLESKGIAAVVDEPEDLVSSGLSAENFWVVLGGDGTMLRAARYATPLGIPLIGINLGNRGFLTDTGRKHGKNAIENVLTGKCVYEKRMTLEAEFGGGEFKPLFTRLALNEVFIGGTGKLAEFSLYVNDKHIEVVRANGLIVATPTGSTAYNMSAGGPVLTPSGKMMVVTPVCPHNFNARPLVLNGSDDVRIVARESSCVFVDGEERGTIPVGESVMVFASAYCATIIKTTPTKFFTAMKPERF